MAYPGAVATQADLLVALNNAGTTLFSAMDASQTTFTVVDPTKIVPYMTVTINSEVILILTVAGNVATSCTRGYGGTTPATHAAGQAVNGNYVQQHHNNLVNEVIAIETLLGVNGTNVATATKASAFLFTMQTAQTLTASVLNTVTPSTMPPGIVHEGENIQYVRIVDGVAGNEVVLLTFINSVSIKFTPTLTHLSGNWTIQSATAGVQEAFFSAAPSDIDLGSGELTLYGKLTLFGPQGNTVRLFGHGVIATRFVRHSTYPAGDLIHYDHTKGPGHLQMQDFGVINANGFNNTSGAGIRLTCGVVEECVLNRVNVTNGFNPIVIDTAPASTGTVVLHDVYAIIYSAYHLAYGCGDCITFSAHGCDFTSVTGAIQSPTATVGSGLRITRSDGVRISGGGFTGLYGIHIDPDPAYIMNFVYVDGILCDTPYSHGIFFEPGSHNAVYSQFRFNACHITNQTGDTTACGIYIGNNPNVVLITGCNVIGFYGSGIVLGVTDSVPTGVTVTGNNISNNGRGATGYGIVIAPTGSGGSGSYNTHTVITGNVISNFVPHLSATQDVGIYFAGAAGKFVGYTIEGNDVSGNTVAPMLKDPTPTMEQIVIGDNNGVTDIFPTVASADMSNADATGLYRSLNVTGVTDITSLTPVWNGREISLFKSDAGSINVTTAGNIAATATIAQNQKRDFTYNLGTGKWFPK